MKKLSLLIFTLGILNANTNDLNITNNCDGLEIYDVVWKKSKDYRGQDEVFLQYGLKNTRDIKLEDISGTVYLKNDRNNRIMENSHSNGDLKPHYINPVDKSRYWGISPIPEEYNGKGDLVVTCKKEEKKAKQSLQKNNEKHDDKFVSIRIKKELYNEIKAQTKTKSPLETELSIVMTLQVMVKEGGLKNMVEKLIK